MGFIGLLFPWGLLLQALALVHFARRRPDTFWLWIIVFLGPLGAAVYIAMEVAPDLGLLRLAFDGLGRRKRITQLEAIVLENPAVGNFEELADLYLDEGHYAKARACYDRAISIRTDHPDPIYRRGIAEIHLGEFEAAVRDLEVVTKGDAKYDLHRAAGLLAHALREHEPARTGGCVVPPGHRDFDGVRNLFQLRRVPGGAGPHRRGARMGAEDSREEADDAPVSPAARAALVPQGERAAEDTRIRLMENVAKGQRRNVSGN